MMNLDDRVIDYSSVSSRPAINTSSLWTPDSLSVAMKARNDTNGEKPPGDYKDLLGVTDPKDTYIQIALSIVLGISAFLAFCVLRRKWTSLYAARKRQRDPTDILPELPTSTFGWIPALWRITEQQVLASAGLDAYVFLRFFRMATKFLTVTLFFAVVVFKPVHDAFPDYIQHPGNHTDNSTLIISPESQPVSLLKDHDHKPHRYLPSQLHYLWMYFVFAYVFTGLAIYMMIRETEKIIGVRQSYLGSQSTITDRTLRLSGIPRGLRSEDAIRAYIERLEIGKVDSVMLCRDWAVLDGTMERRAALLRKLEESWTVYANNKRNDSKVSGSDQNGFSRDADDESGPLISTTAEDGTRTASTPSPHRPKATIRYGVFKLQSRYVDAIDHYEEKLRETDLLIEALRKDEFEPTPIAFVTMDSVASCQMAVQAVLSPSPGQLLAKLGPAPADVVWSNTYMSKANRRFRNWSVTVIILLLTVFWSGLLVPVAGILNLESIARVSPGLANALKENDFARSLVTTQLPTLLTTLLFVAVPYLYDWLANLQGIISQGDVELSVISKNFFFLFFNYFIVFTVLGSLSNFYKLLDQFKNSLKDTTWIANQLATSLQDVLSFYTNLIILQGIGLFPFRLLEIGSVLLYPFYRFVAKTPRDFAELNEPAVFNYGFYLPQVMLIFTICIVYSVLRDSWKVLLAGILYFLIGHGVYKYQLLYAMEHRQHSTGKAWIMICSRMTMGLVLFQLTTAGQLALKRYFELSFAIVPLIGITIWFSVYFMRTYNPLMNFIALQSIERQIQYTDDPNVDPDGWGEAARLRYESESHQGQNVDESASTGNRFINPNLVITLEEVWLEDGGLRRQSPNPPSRATSPRRRLATTLNAL